MVNGRVVILTAVAMEARAIASAWGLPTPKPGQPARTAGSSPTVEIHLIGIAGVRMPTDLNEGKVLAIIMAGLGGGLDPTLAIGDVVIDDCPAAWLPDVPHRIGKILASSTMIATPAEKQQLFQSSGALAVDMESQTARATAIKVGAAFVSIRAISDTASEALDPTLLKLVDNFGKPRPLAIAGRLIQRPALIPQLKRLGSNATFAAEKLSEAVVAIVGKVA